MVLSDRDIIIYDVTLMSHDVHFIHPTFVVQLYHERVIAMMDYIQPELLILIPVLYLIAEAIKKSKVIKCKYIPISIGIIGIVMSALYTMGIHGISVETIFVSITQGILCAGASTYANQIYKQIGKNE